jgi:phosphoglucosamine mutase
MGKLFGTDGVRGLANEYPMTAEMSLNIGRAVAHLFKRKDHTSKIIIGKDTRLSGYMLENALISGVCSMGADAYLLNVLPTPGIAFMTRGQKADAGVVISASHNPFKDNGIKIFSGNGFKLSLEKESQIEELILNNNHAIDDCLPEPKDLGRAFRLNDAVDLYTLFLRDTFPKELSMRGMKIALDCANGATYRVAPKVFSELGAEVFSIHANPDGLNINSNCGSQHPEDLANAVIKYGAEIGMAFDGDGDRVIAVDEKGNTITGNQILLIYSNTLKKEGKLKNNTVVTTIMSNLGLDIALKERGINHVKSDVGDRNVLKDMLARDSVIGGEDSGHLIFLDYHTTGDGILSGLQLISSMLKEKKPLSELAAMMTIYPQVLINVDVRSKPNISNLPEVAGVIAEVEKELGEKGRVLIRYSGTQQMCRVMVEGPTTEATDAYCKKIADVVKKTIG